MSDFRQLLSTETPSLQRYAQRLCCGAPWAEDLLQETLLLALRLEDDFTPGTNLRAWLFTLMRNTYRNEERKRRRRSRITVEEYAQEYSIAGVNGQESSLALSQTLQALDALPPLYRETLLAVAIEGRTYEEASQIIGRPIGTVRSRLSRARMLLKKTLEEQAH